MINPNIPFITLTFFKPKDSKYTLFQCHPDFFTKKSDAAALAEKIDAVIALDCSVKNVGKPICCETEGDSKAVDAGSTYSYASGPQDKSNKSPIIRAIDHANENEFIRLFNEQVTDLMFKYESNHKRFHWHYIICQFNYIEQIEKIIYLLGQANPLTKDLMACDEDFEDSSFDSKLVNENLTKVHEAAVKAFGDVLLTMQVLPSFPSALCQIVASYAPRVMYTFDKPAGSVS